MHEWMIEWNKWTRKIKISNKKFVINLFVHSSIDKEIIKKEVVIENGLELNAYLF